MKWDFKTKSRLAKIVWEKSRTISEGVRADNLIDFRNLRDRLNKEYFEKVGFQRAYTWRLDKTPHFPQLFKASKTHLLFLINTNYVMKVDKKMAEKILVLGLP